VKAVADQAELNGRPTPLVSRDSPCFTEGDLSVWMNQWS
jgi:hypothetical protein